MYAIKAIYDGGYFKLEEPVPVKENYEVIITFTKPLNTSQEEILKYFNTWDDEDVKIMDEIVEERANFSLNRDELSRIY
jgi:predicted DNA-binding antitoxin AbrB/MazE fold protein